MESKVEKEMETNFRRGDRIGGYRVVRELGKGGMGRVYEVEHEKLGVRYALKTFTLERGVAVDLLRNRFLVEGKVLARLRHPSLVRVYDLDVDVATKTPYFVMDLVLDGGGRPLTMDDVRPGKVDEATLAKWFGELASALDYIHAKGIVHRDIKPNNVLIDEFGSVMLTDFGVSRYVTDELREKLDVSSRTGADGRPLESTMRLVLGTRAFMAPEVKEGRAATPASDAYSLGIVFFWMLTGVWPSGNSEQYAILKAFDRDWWSVLPWLLNSSPNLRPPTLKEAAAQLRASRREPPVRQTPPRPKAEPPPAPRPPKVTRNPFWHKVVVVGVTIGVATASFWATGNIPIIMGGVLAGLVSVGVCALFGLKVGTPPLEKRQVESDASEGERMEEGPEDDGSANRSFVCPYCGEEMLAAAALPDAQHVRCPHCGEKTQYDALKDALVKLRSGAPVRIALPPEAIIGRTPSVADSTSPAKTVEANRVDRDGLHHMQRIPTLAIDEVKKS